MRPERREKRNMCFGLVPTYKIMFSLFFEIGEFYQSTLGIGYVGVQRLSHRLLFFLM